MGSDVLYESKHPGEVARGLTRFLKPGGVIILADPGRNYLNSFLEAMEDIGFDEEREILEVDGKMITILRLSEKTE